MKKLAVLSIALLMLTSLVFAEVMVEPKVEFSGDGTLTWGIDLTTMNSGFSNTDDVNLTVTLLAPSDETKGGAEGDTVFGSITLGGMSVILNSNNNYTIPMNLVADAAGAVTGELSGADVPTTIVPSDYDFVNGETTVPMINPPSVTANVMLGPAKWFIYGAPDLLVDFAATPLEDDPDDAAWWAEGDESNNVAPDFGDGATGLELAAGPATIDVFLASSADWTAAGNYGAGAKVGLTLGPATLNAGVNYGPFATGGILGAGVSASVVAGPATVNAAFDFATPTTAWETTAGVALALADVADIAANLGFSDSWSLDTELSTTLKAVPNLDLTLLVGLWNLTTDLAWGARVTTGYKIAMGETNFIKPGATISVSTPAGGSLILALDATLTADLIPNTEFVLEFVDHYLTGGTGDPVITFATTVSY